MHLNVVTTLRCDFHCRHCLLGCPARRDLDPAAFRQALDGLVPHGLASVTFTGGEAHLHPAFETLVDAAAERGLAFEVVSNAWSYAAYAGAIARHRPFSAGIRFSLDGLEASHDRLRRLGSFRRVAEAVGFYRVRGIPVGVNVVLHDGNLAELAPLVAWCAGQGVCEIKLAGMIPAPGHRLALSDEGRARAAVAAPWLARRHDVRIQVASSLLRPATTLFCPVLEARTLTLTSEGAFSFCCDVPGPGAVVGHPGEPPEDLLARMSRTAHEIVLGRILQARQDSLTPDDRWCLHCHRFFGLSPRGA